MNEEILALEREIYEKSLQLAKLKGAQQGTEVPDYTFTTATGEVALSTLFGGQEQLLVIHNMGQGCRYCTLWADGLNGQLAHLESAMAVVLVSKDPPEVQRRLANTRGWRFAMASHGGGDYIREQTVMEGQDNMPGAVVYQKRDGKLFRRNACVFGPGDLYCPTWHLLGMAGFDTGNWTPQFAYWQRPWKMDDGGENLPD